MIDQENTQDAWNQYYEYKNARRSPCDKLIKCDKPDIRLRLCPEMKERFDHYDQRKMELDQKRKEIDHIETRLKQQIEMAFSLRTAPGSTIRKHNLRWTKVHENDAVYTRLEEVKDFYKEHFYPYIGGGYSPPPVKIRLDKKIDETRDKLRYRNMKEEEYTFLSTAPIEKIIREMEPRFIQYMPIRNDKGEYIPSRKLLEEAGCPHVK